MIKVSTGNSNLDKVLKGGYVKKKVTGVGARPAMGKTKWLLTSAVDTSTMGFKSLIISLDLTLQQCYERIQYTYSKELIESVQNNLSIHDTFPLNTNILDRIITQHKNTNGLDVLFIDLLQIMYTLKGDYPRSREDYDEILNHLNLLAEKHDIAIVIFIQFRRTIERRENKRPTPDDLFESGILEKHFSTFIALYRDVFYNMDTEKPNTLEMIILKNEFGKELITLEEEFILM